MTLERKDISLPVSTRNDLKENLITLFDDQKWDKYKYDFKYQDQIYATITPNPEYFQLRKGSLEFQGNSFTISEFKDLVKKVEFRDFFKGSDDIHCFKDYFEDDYGKADYFLRFEIALREKNSRKNYALKRGEVEDAIDKVMSIDDDEEYQEKAELLAQMFDDCSTACTPCLGRYKAYIEIMTPDIDISVVKKKILPELLRDGSTGTPKPAKKKKKEEEYIDLENLDRKELTGKLKALVDGKKFDHEFGLNGQTDFTLTLDPKKYQSGNGVLKFRGRKSTWKSLKPIVTNTEFRDFYNSSEKINPEYFESNFCEADFLMRFEIARRIEVSRKNYPLKREEVEEAIDKVMSIDNDEEYQEKAALLIDMFADDYKLYLYQSRLNAYAGIMNKKWPELREEILSDLLDLPEDDSSASLESEMDELSLGSSESNTEN